MFWQCCCPASSIRVICQTRASIGRGGPRAPEEPPWRALGHKMSWQITKLNAISDCEPRAPGTQTSWDVNYYPFWSNYIPTVSTCLLPSTWGFEQKRYLWSMGLWVSLQLPIESYGCMFEFGKPQ